ncbi:hypothetical protein MCG01_13555 [Enterococcus hirae]|nr:hypothetical protein [Enterococcus hirae]MCH1976393.1 hypothetical protein [Enterococcus hirae]MCH1976436.1 hypothetical protein [Enterococcus hirae]MCH1976598.1 hypothetical protein [Enterococcus hirae]MCH1978121.1 hypothetical protein [Enterococcus hirae]
MSTTEIYAIEKNGDVVPYGSAKNSWLGGMHVWKSLDEKYDLGGDMLIGFDATWKAFNKGIYEEYENVVLGSTFDNVIVLKENIDQLLTSFKKYYSVYPNSNFGQQIEVIEAIKADENIIGVAWCQTSVVDDLWDYGYDEEKDKVIPYNIFKGENHGELFELLEDSK